MTKQIRPPFAWAGQYEWLLWFLCGAVTGFCWAMILGIFVLGIRV